MKIEINLDDSEYSSTHIQTDHVGESLNPVPYLRRAIAEIEREISGFEAYHGVSR